MAAPKAERAASNLLEEYDMSEPPVPVEDLARLLGARISFQQFGSEVSGILYRDADRVVIGVNASHATTRQRFTVAHEIGHLRLHKGRPMFVDRIMRIDRRDTNASSGVDPQEIEANSFAAALLMPQEMILAILNSSIPKGGRASSGVVAGLARKFKVSTQSMEFRLANLGLAMPSE